MTPSPLGPRKPKIEFITRTPVQPPSQVTYALFHLLCLDQTVVPTHLLRESDNYPPYFFFPPFPHSCPTNYLVLLIILQKYLWYIAFSLPPLVLSVAFLKTKHETEKTKTQTKKWPAGQYVNNKLKVLSVYDVLTTYQVLYGCYLI